MNRTSEWKRSSEGWMKHIRGDKCEVCGWDDDIRVHYRKDENGKKYTLGQVKAANCREDMFYVLCEQCQKRIAVGKLPIEYLKERCKEDWYLGELRMIQENLKAHGKWQNSQYESKQAFDENDYKIRQFLAAYTKKWSGWMPDDSKELTIEDAINGVEE